MASVRPALLLPAVGGPVTRQVFLASAGQAARRKENGGWLLVDMPVSGIAGLSVSADGRGSCCGLGYPAELDVTGNLCPWSMRNPCRRRSYGPRAGAEDSKGITTRRDGTARFEATWRRRGLLEKLQVKQCDYKKLLQKGPSTSVELLAPAVLVADVEVRQSGYMKLQQKENDQTAEQDDGAACRTWFEKQTRITSQHCKSGCSSEATYAPSWHTRHAIAGHRAGASSPLGLAKEDMNITAQALYGDLPR
ncbi:unnamed protein product [Symbiodinium microadriaticum]|nr:unnamed protein product [Symbiodinium microadriaticum]